MIIYASRTREPLKLVFCKLPPDDHGFLVEPSCGITLASIYSEVLPKVIEDREFKTNKGPIVLIVCGGSDMSHEILEDLATRFDLSLKD